MPSGGPEAIVSIGSGLTTIVVHEDGVPHFVRTIAEGGDTITAAIAGALDLPIDDAESTKRNLDQTGPHIRAAAVAAQDAAASLIAEIRSSVDYYSTLPGRHDVRRVKLTGGGSRLAGMAERLQQQTRAEVVAGSALARLDVSSLNLSPDDIIRRDPLVSTVVGLALPDPPGVKSLDLLPPEILTARHQHRVERTVIAVAVVIVLALAGLGVLRYLDVRNAENTVTTETQTIENLNTQIARQDREARIYSEITADEAAAAPVLRYEVDWPLVLTDLAKATPAGGTVTSVSGTWTPQVAPASTTGVAPTTTLAPTTTAGLENVDIASLSVTLSTTQGFAYFKTWLQAMETSPQFRYVAYSTLTHTATTVTWSAQLVVLATVKSGRLAKFEVTK